MRLKESTTTCGSAELDLHAEHPRRELPRYRRLLVRTFSSRRSRAGIQKGKCPTSRVRPVLYLQTGAMFALAAPRSHGLFENSSECRRRISLAERGDIGVTAQIRMPRADSARSQIRFSRCEATNEGGSLHDFRRSRMPQRGDANHLSQAPVTGCP